MHKSLLKVYPDSDGRTTATEISSMVGSINCDHVFFNSPYTKKMYQETSEIYFKKEYTKKVFEKSSIVPCCVLNDDLNYIEPQKDKKIPIIVWNHRLQAYKQWKKSFSVLNQLYKEGLKFKVVVVNTNRENHKQVLQYPFVETKLVKTRSQYLEILKTADINTLNSIYETFCICAVESMALGQVLVAPQGITFPYITGQKETKYPYLFSSLTEQKEQLKKLILDVKERKKWGKILSNHVHENFRTERSVENVLNVIEEIYFKTNTLNSRNETIFQTALEASLKKSNIFSNVVTFLRNYKKNNVSYFGTQAWPTSQIIRYMRKFNYDINTKNGVQYVKKNKK